LFFCFCVDLDDNDLASLEAIHLFVKVMDIYFGGDVCELDLIFNLQKVSFSFFSPKFILIDKISFIQVYIILDEVFLAGELLESSEEYIIERLNALDKME